jgi:hypothetical protein
MVLACVGHDSLTRFNVRILRDGAASYVTKFRYANAAIIAFDGFFFVGYAGGVYTIWTFLNSRRIEYYDRYLRLFSFGGRAHTDFEYSKVKLGNLKMRVISGAVSWHFRIMIAGADKSYDVGNSKKNYPESDLFTWLSERAERDRDS